MKFPPSLPKNKKLDIHSLGLQTCLELAAGGLFTIVLIRWVQM
jgi:hypothetical protein